MGEWRKLHNEDLNDVFSSQNIVRVIGSRKLKWAEHVVLMGERRGGVYSVLVENPEGESHWGDAGVDGRTILRRTFRKWDVGEWTGSGWLRTGTGGDHFWMW